MAASSSVPRPSTLTVTFKSDIENFSLTLRGVRRIGAFIDSERARWDALRKANAAIVSDHLGYYNSVMTQLQLFERSESEADLIANGERMKTLCAQGHPGNRMAPIIFSGMGIGPDMFDMLARGGEYARGASYLLRKEELPTRREDVRPEFLQGLIDANTLLQREKTKAGMLSADEKARISTLITDAGKEYEDAQSYYETMRESIDDMLKISEAQLAHELQQYEEMRTSMSVGLDEIVKKREDEFDALKSSYYEQLRLQGPAKLWEGISASYKQRGRIWLALLLSLSAISIWVFCEILFSEQLERVSEIVDPVTGKLKPVGVKAIAMLIAVLSVIAYAMRTIGKLALSAFHLQRDADERSALTLYYLALLKEGDATKDERLVIVQSLFSRADTGLLGKGEHGPSFASLSGEIMNRNS